MSSKVDILGVYDSVYYADGEEVFKYNPRTEELT